MENIFVEFLPPWVETGLQPAFYDKESGTVLQQTARMYARVNMLIRMFNKLSKNTKEEVERFEGVVNDEIEKFEHDVNETVDEYIEKFTALKDFVDDYFDNLDVQEEINNKLDDMVEQGTLQEIITEYIDATALWMFDTVADMKLSTNFVNGSYAKTLGFYTKSDQGGAIYKIRTKTVDDTADEMTLIDLYDNTLVAELVKTNEMNVKQFGAKGDGTTDDTTAIQTAFNYVKNINIPSGTYMIDADTTLLPNSGNRIRLDSDATLKAITNDLTHYRIIHLVDVVDVEISGGTIEGDRLTHTGDSGEWGACMRAVGDCDKIYIHDINLINAWGDGLSVIITGSMVTERVHVKNARRNGYSIAQAGNFTSNDDLIEDTNGTLPQYGVDIEPDLGTEFLKNVVFNNLTTKNNASGGIEIFLTKQNSVFTNITINDYCSLGDSRGIWLTSSTHIGSVTINNPRIEDCTGTNAIYVHPGDTLVEYKIIKPFIRHYRTNAAANYAITFNGYDSDISQKGNVIIENPTIIEPVGTATESAKWAIGFETAHGTWDKVKIIDPISLGGRRIRLGGNMGYDNLICDNYEAYTLDADSSITLGNDGLYSLVTSSAYTTNRYVAISSTASFPIGYTAKFINTGDYTLTVRFTSQYIYPLSTTSGKYVTLDTKGSSMTIRKISSDSWVVVSQTGTLTVSN